MQHTCRHHSLLAAGQVVLAGHLAQPHAAVAAEAPRVLDWLAAAPVPPPATASVSGICSSTLRLATMLSLLHAFTSLMECMLGRFTRTSQVCTVAISCLHPVPWPIAAGAWCPHLLMAELPLAMT